MNAKDRGCLCKRRYDSKAECEAGIAAVVQTKPWLDGLMRAYKCPWGRHWHMTKQAQSNLRRDT